MEKQNFVYVYVPKVACTNWKGILRHLMGHENYLDPVLAHDKANGGLIYLNNRNDSQAILTNPDIQKFSFIRNPYTRVLSAYRNKIEPFNKGDSEPGDRNFWHQIFSLIRDETNSEDVNFLCFLTWLKHSDSFHAKNEHWMPQHQILNPQSTKYDFIGRFENIGADSAKLLKLMNCDLSFPTQKDVKFPGTFAGKHMETYYDAPTRELVQELYADDFHFFDYKL